MFITIKFLIKQIIILKLNYQSLSRFIANSSDFRIYFGIFFFKLKVFILLSQRLSVLKHELSL